MNILMTGCGKSFGAYIRERLIAQGHQVYGVGLDGPDTLVDFNYLTEMGVDRILDQAWEEMGSVDCLINNAGVTHIDWTERHPLSDFQRVFRVNVTIPFLFVKSYLRRIKRCIRVDREVNAGATDFRFLIINTCSMSSRMGLRACPAYPASKAALETMTRCWAKEFAGRLPIIVLGISPGNIEHTNMVSYAIDSLQRTRGMSKEEAETYNAQSPLGRYATYDEVWKVFNFAVNEAPEYMTGSIITMPNGMGIP